MKKTTRTPSQPPPTTTETPRSSRRRRLKIHNLKSSSSSSSSNTDAVSKSRRRSHHHHHDNDNSPSPPPPDSESTCVSHGSSSIVGRRREMEDAVTVAAAAVSIGSRRFDFFGVYDGHGGARVAEACRERMHRILQSEMAAVERGRGEGGVFDWEDVMEKCFERMDVEVGGQGNVNAEEMTVGSTAVVAVVGREEVVVANCGDSRAVMCRGGVAVPLSVDHKPDSPDELARIEAAGGRVINWNGPRILGVLATSRAVGDHYLRPYVTSRPEVKIYSRTRDNEFLILATDGLWDVVSNQVACQVVRRCLNGRIRKELLEMVDGTVGRMRTQTSDAAAALLTELAVTQGSMDNVSVVVVQLRKCCKKSTCS